MKGHEKMKIIGETKKNLKKQLITAALLSAAFVLFTLLVCSADVRPVGVRGTNVGFADALYFVLMVLPLYPKPRDGYIFAVNLFEYTDISPVGMLLYLVLFAGLVITGALKIAASYFGYQKYGKILTAVSLTLGIFTVLFLAMHREPYAASISFLLFVLKVILVMKHEKINR